MGLLEEISEYLQKGRAKNVKALVQQALDEDLDPKEILNVGLLSGMMIIGAKFKNNEVFVPEVLVAARAMNAGLAVLEPKLIEIGNEPVGRAVIGTVQGDLHDIGKNLVAMMLKGAGFEIYDLGVDVDPSVYIDKAEKYGIIKTRMITEIERSQSHGTQRQQDREKPDDRLFRRVRSPQQVHLLRLPRQEGRL